MKTAALVYEFPSLSETFVLSQISGLIDAGCDVRIFADSADESAASQVERALLDRVRYFGLPLKRMRELVGTRKSKTSPPTRSADVGRPSQSTSISGGDLIRLKLEARAFRTDPIFDVIHAHFGPNGVRAVGLRSLRAIAGPVITSFYGYDVGRHWARAGYHRLFNEGERFIALSDHMRAQLVALGCPAEKIVIHRLGVDLDQFSISARSNRERIEIISLARLVQKKGIEDGLRAVAELARRKIAVRYTIVGRGPLSDSLENLAGELGIQDVVRFSGALSHHAIGKMLNESDVLLAPSVTAQDGDIEGTPVAILEAHASGLPVVATRHAGIPEIVEDGKSGFLVPERSVDDLADQLARLAESASLRETMGLAGRAAVAEKHDIRRLNADLLRLYREVAAR